MPTTAKGRRIVRLALTLALLLMTCSAFFSISAQPAKADDSGDNYPWSSATLLSSGDWGYTSCPASDTGCKAATETYNGVKYGVVDPWGYYLRYCTSWVAWALHDRNNFEMPHAIGNAADWASWVQNNRSSVSVNSTPVKGAVAHWNGHIWNGGYGHVAWVETVNGDGSIVVEEYNYTQNGTSGAWDRRTITKSGTGSSALPDNYIHFADLSDTSTETPTSTPSIDNTVLAVKKLTMTDGTNEVFWAKKTDVFESWWRSGTGITTTSLINIAQGDIKAIDVQLMSDNEHLLYTATAGSVWETWWYPGQGMHTAQILSGIGNIHKVQKTIGPDGVTNQLYILTDTGVSEYWWNSGSNGVRGGSLYTLAYPVAMQKFVEPTGTQVLYVADQNYAYMVRWGSGVNGIQVTTLINVSAITSLSFSEDSDGKHRLYIGSKSGAIWEASWYTGGSIGYWYMAGGAPVVALQKWESGSTQVLYEATAGGVFEFYWSQTSNASLRSGTIVGGLGDVHAFVRATDPNGVQSVYTATGTNVLESWWIPGGNGITTGTIA